MLHVNSGNMQKPKTKTTSVEVFSSSVIGFKCKEGVVIAYNPLGLYGTTVKYRNVDKIKSVAPNLMFSSSGDFSDFQQVSNILEKEWHRLSVYGNAKKANPAEFGSYLANECYKKRNKADPFYLSAILGGVLNGNNYLAMVDLYGNYIEHDYVATGIANMMAPVLIDQYYRPDMTFEQIKPLILDCFKVLHAKNKLVNNEVVIAFQTEEKCWQEKYEVDISYSFEGFLKSEKLF
jgi:20S proteasome subunit beta 7